MHKFLRAVGFSRYQKKRALEQLLDSFAENPEYSKQIPIEQDANLCEIRVLVAPGMGISMFGEMSPEGQFSREYYYPFLYGDDISSTADCSIQRHTEKETYAGLLDEYRVGISLIFYLVNEMEYKWRKLEKESVKVSSAKLTGLALSGKILLPVKKSESQKARARVASMDRNNLIEAAKNGDEDAMETLTIEDIDMYSQISRRMLKEDIYTIIDSFFMPCGVECDQYSLIGEITKIEEKVNRITEEVIYDLTLDCNDMIIHVGVNKQDLTGEPVVGRRFKGQIWMQGRVEFSKEKQEGSLEQAQE